MKLSSETGQELGALYRVRQAHTSAAHWTPDAVASLYERQ